MGIGYILRTGKQGVIDSSTSIDPGVVQAEDIDDAALGNGLQGGYKSEDQTSSAVSVKLNEGAFTQGSGLQVGANGVALSTYAMGRVTSFHAVHSGSTSVAANAAEATITPVNWNSQNITIVANSIIYVRATITALETTTGSLGANGAGWMMQAVIRRAATGNAALVDTNFVNHAFKDVGLSDITPTITLASNVLTITCPSSTSIDIDYKVTCEVLSTMTVN